MGTATLARLVSIKIIAVNLVARAAHIHTSRLQALRDVTLVGRVDIGLVPLVAHHVLPADTPQEVPMQPVPSVGELHTAPPVLQGQPCVLLERRATAVVPAGIVQLANIPLVVVHAALALPDSISPTPVVPPVVPVHQENIPHPVHLDAATVALVTIILTEDTHDAMHAQQVLPLQVGLHPARIVMQVHTLPQVLLASDALLVGIRELEPLVAHCAP